MRTFVQLRQDLERVRNLCYMVGRREKLCRSFLRLREQTFHKQALVLFGPPLPAAAVAAIMEANHGPSIYDRLYSHPDSEDHTHDFETLVARIAGVKSPTPVSSDEKKMQPDFNGASNKKLYFNGSVRRKSLYGSDLSISSSETEVTKPTKTTSKCTSKSKSASSVKVEIESSSEDEANASKSKTPARRKSKKVSALDRPRTKTLRDSSESDKLDTINSRSRTLQHMEKELGSATGSESDELLPLSTNAASRLGPSVASAIYSDTDSDSLEHHSSHSAVLITKAAVKEFSAADISKNSSQKNFTCKDTVRQEYHHADEPTKNKENAKGSKKKDYIPSALIVPQRQAAKKASEIMQRTQCKKENTANEPVEFVKSPGEEASKPPKPSTTKEKPSNKKQRDSKTTKEVKNNDVYDFDKDFGDGTEILAYVPQRQAAKKAAEHIKSGMGTKTAQPDLETADVKPKKELMDGKKKENKKEESPKKEEPPRKDEPLKERKGKKSVPECSKSASSILTSNSESSSSSSCSSSSESSSDSDVAKSPLQKAAIVSKEPISSSTTTTSSESDTGNQVKSRTVNKRQVNKVVHEDNEAEKSVAGRKLKKLPDKKLKTSDGRHGPEFQPPLTEREEPGRTIVPKELQQHQQHHHQQQQQQQQQHQHHHQQQQQQQQSLGKKADQRDSSKKSLQPQQTSDQSVLGGSRDNDGIRGVSGAKSAKKSGQLIKQTQQSTSRNKEDSGAGSRAKTETRKRKSSETIAKDEKIFKESIPLKKVEKKLSERTNKESEKDCKYDVGSKSVSETVESPKMTENTTKADDKKIKKTSHRNAINTLEEEMKQRRAERDAPKKSSRGLDKLLEKREHLDKLSRNRTVSQEMKLEKSLSIEDNQDNVMVPEKPVVKETIKPEEMKNHMNEQAVMLDTTRIEKEDSVKKDVEIVSEKSAERRKKVDQKIENVSEVQIVETAGVDVVKESGDNVSSKSAPDKIVAADMPERECQKRRKSVNRSIFSPQHHGSKDPSVSELFDFDHDILTDDMVNDDGISIPRDEERAATLTFSFNNELWFKEDSKEDSARETLHLVEKLRMELSKKSNSSQFESESVPAEEESRKEEVEPAEKPALEQQPQQQQQQPLLHEKAEMLEQPVEEQPVVPSAVVPPVEIKGDSREPIEVSSEDDLARCKNHTIEEKRKPCYSSNNSEHYMYGNEERETAKVTVVERAKLEMDADADERWVPPSLPCPPENYNLSTLMDNQNHRYAAHPQFPNDIAAVMPPETNPDALVHLQLNINMQDQYLLQQTHSLERVQHLEAHADQSRVQSLAMMDQQVAGIPGQIVDEITPMEMVNRHLIGLPNSEDDQGSEMDRVLDKDDISSDIRQDYTQSGSPYNELNGARPDTRWAESQVLPSRRSTSSSITSASSAEDHAAIPPYKSVPPIPYPPCTMDAAPYHYSETSSYGAGAVSLFPPQSCTAPLPYPSPGTAMFPPPFGAAFPTPQSLLPHVPKPLEESLNMQASPCTAAFTSSSHNMALTAAMVSPTKVPTPPPPPPPQQPSVPQQSSATQQQQVQQQQQVPPPSQLQSSETPQALAPLLPQQVNSPTVPASFLNTIPEVQISETAVENLPEVLTDSKSAPSGKKSPAKPTRTSARVTSLQGKSPGKSPRQETTKTVPSARGRSRSAKGSQQSGYRGRGRGRGRRGRGNQSSIVMAPMTSNTLHNDDSIQNKLVGTVYDFDSDEDSANETNIADLRMMRERKKSTDVNEKRGESLGMTNDAIQSHLSSPGALHKKYADDKKLSSPATHEQAALAKSDANAGQTFVDTTVMPLLPGPVDMRTYNSTVDQPSSSVHGQSYGNHLLGSFAAGVSTDPNLQDMEDFESELHSVLKKATGKQQLVASDGLEGSCMKTDFADPSAMDPSATSSFNDANKVSLTDSRNQLKVKIKGPFLDANYVAASSVPPLAQQAPVIITPTANTAAVASGTSNLRRMRKKELLRQYCSQDMNMDDPTRENVTSAPINMQPINHGQRTVITIPKAVASMTSIPTREDYKAVVDANMEKKRRKERSSGGGSSGSGSGNVGGVVGAGGGSSSSSGFLDVTTVTEEEGSSDRRRGLMVGAVDRRRGRQTRPTATTVTNSAHPKLKIKIGNSIIGGQEVGNAQDDCSRIRPPKKRLSSIPSSAPSMEELRRESMKFRKMIMAGFDNDEKTKAKSKRDKNGKRKRRQYNRKEARVQILEGDAPKLIIRLGKPSANSTSTSSAMTDSASDMQLDAVVSVAAAGDENDNQQRSTDKDSRVGPPPPEPSKEEVVYPVAGGVDKKQPTDPNAGATALRNVRSAKVTPIRLKLTRCQEGYELRAPVASSASVDDGSGGSSKNSSATTATVVNSLAPLPAGAVNQETTTATAAAAGRLPAAGAEVAIAATAVAAEMRPGEQQQHGVQEKQSSKENDIPLLSQSANHSSSGCPPAPLPQGCQVR